MVRFAEPFSFYPVKTEFSIPGSLSFICSIAVQGEFQKPLFQEVHKQKPNILEALNARISCQDGFPVKGFDLKYKHLSPIRSVGYGLKCCMEVRFSKITRKKLVAELTGLGGSNLHE